MASTVAQELRQRCGGRYAERKFVLPAEPVMDVQAVLLDEAKRLSERARAQFAAAEEDQRRAARISAVLLRLRGAVADSEQRKTA